MSKYNPERDKRYREEHKEQIKVWMRGYMRKYNAKSGPGGINRRERRLREYGINSTIYAEMLKEQGNCCAICGKSQAECSKALEVDHDHVTGVVRGLLCTNCNLLLGRAHDDIELLKKAIYYLGVLPQFTEQ